MRELIDHGPVLATMGLFVGLLGCTGASATKEHSDRDLVGTYRFHEKTIGSKHGPEILILNTDGSFFQFYGSLNQHAAKCNVGRWDRSDKSHVGLNGLMRWEEDPSGLGTELTDSTIDFSAPLEDEGSTISLVLNDDLGRRFVKDRD